MTTFRPPSDEELRSEALEFYKGQPKRYRELRKSDELEEMLDLKVEETKRYAANLIASGTFARQAWPWAIRVKILETEPD